MGLFVEPLGYCSPTHPLHLDHGITAYPGRNIPRALGSGYHMASCLPKDTGEDGEELDLTSTLLQCRGLRVLSFVFIF